MSLDQQSRPACVYRHGRIVCGGARVTFRQSRRLGLTSTERRSVRIVFASGISGELYRELAEMTQRRGAAATRYADRIEPVTIVVEDPQDGRVELRGRIKPPTVAPAPDVQHVEFPIGTT